MKEEEIKLRERREESMSAKRCMNVPSLKARSSAPFAEERVAQTLLQPGMRVCLMSLLFSPQIISIGVVISTKLWGELTKIQWSIRHFIPDKLRLIKVHTHVC